MWLLWLRPCVVSGDYYTLDSFVNFGAVYILFACLHRMLPPLPSNRHHRSCGNCLKGKGENYQVCSVQYCVQQLCTVRCTHI